MFVPLLIYDFLYIYIYIKALTLVTFDEKPFSTTH